MGCSVAIFITIHTTHIAFVQFVLVFSLIMLKKMMSIFLLRLLALGATISATVVTLTTHDSRHVLNLTFKASYSNAPTLRYVTFHLTSLLHCIDTLDRIPAHTS